MDFLFKIELKEDHIVLSFSQEDLGKMPTNWPTNPILHRKEKREYPGPIDDCKKMWEAGGSDRALLLGMLGLSAYAQLYLKYTGGILTSHIEQEFLNQLKHEQEMMMLYGPQSK